MRHLLLKKGVWRQELAAASLPEPAARLVEAVVSKTRLREGERRGLTRELIAHFADGLEAGASAESLVESFGEAELAAKLMTRAKKRCRGPVYHVYVAARRVLIVFIAALVVTWSWLAMMYFGGEPKVTVDYLAEIQRDIEIEHPGPARWREWIDLWGDAPDLVDRADGDDNETGVITPQRRSEVPAGGLTDAERAAVKDAQAWIARARELALSDGSLGWPHYMAGVPRAFSEMLIERDGTDDGDMVEVAWDPSEHLLIEARLPYLNEFRRAATWLSHDAILAAETGEGGRAVDDVRAILAASERTAEMPTLINWLVHVAMRTLAVDTTLHVLAAHPDAFEREELVLLAHSLASLGGPLEAPLGAERAMMYDVLQRTYTDDGAGDGHLTSKGVDVLDSLASNGEFLESTALGQLAETALGPASIAVIASRADTRRLYDDLMDDMVRYGQTPRWNRDERPSDRFHNGEISMLRYPLLYLLVPAIESAFTSADRLTMNRDAALVAVALLLHRSRAGVWPGSLDELVPGLLPEVPRDPYDGSRLGYALTDSGPVVYAKGPDLDDDGGTWGELPAATRGRDMVPFRGFDATPDGDWILFRPGGTDPTAEESLGYTPPEPVEQEGLGGIAG